MRAALASEYRKLFTTQMWWILLLVMFGYMVFLGVIMAFSLTLEPGSQAGGGMSGSLLGGEGVARTVYTVGNSVGYVFPLIIGALAMTGEYRHQTITPTLLAEPNRGVLLVAKLGSGLPVGLLYGVVGTVGAIVGGAPVLAWKGEGTYLGHSAVIVAALLAVAALVVWTLVGIGFGTLLPNQVAAVVVVLAFTQFVEPILRVVLGAVDALSAVARFLPGAASDAVVGNSVYTITGSVDLLPRWAGALVLVAYAVVFAALGRWVTLRRDVT